MTAGRWSVVVPVKGAAGKSRLGDDPRRARFAWAFAQDAVAAVVATADVGEVIVVCADVEDARRMFPAARIVADPGRGLNAAIRAGLETVPDARADTAVLLGDVPALTSGELAAALLAARGFERALVPDADGSGTVLTTAREGTRHVPRFGSDSRVLHEAVGYREIFVPAESGLRRDVDALSHLEGIDPSRLGAHTRAVLTGSAAPLRS
ncbi:2-phospho-L-lactate guanylyltransferase [Herbiconiux sp. L3-i23]|uniref:2-phospho-L-lactate guanylyltransferase n=1 Tax=Herbiconiux sp. L3-i23 TaxID=2905871 RepID=UPI002063C83F|nr:2-phospho-L-lactate guanylyltransferase [Herbiconiux sp. L3-i23]BDI21841.1 2-phospho-L-lactate guanylyltransferase [Herbiconiux sp. L3-i23]